MRLVVITPPEIAGWQHEAQLAGAMLRRLAERPGQVLHVRKPGASREDVASYLRQLDPDCLQRVVLHQHHDLAAEMVPSIKVI